MATFQLPWQDCPYPRLGSLGTIVSPIPGLPLISLGLILPKKHYGVPRQGPSTLSLVSDLEDPLLVARQAFPLHNKGVWCPLLGPFQLLSSSWLVLRPAGYRLWVPRQACS